MAMRKYEIQKLYLTIQQSIGELEIEAAKPERDKLRDISIQLLRVKRNMIGTFDEVDAGALPL
jgi:hypothetical protein